MLDVEACSEAPIAREFEGAALGDPRRQRRLVRVAERAMAAPSVGFPRMVADDSELEGVYRLLSNEHVEPEAVLEPHLAATFGRMREVEGVVLVAHDTTELVFGGHSRDDLGLTTGKQYGFRAHVALAILPGEERYPLGCCGLVRVRRTEHKHSTNKSSRELSQDPARESSRWGELLQQVSERARGTCIHLMDREGDSYDLLALMLRRRDRFVVRACYDRALAAGGSLFESFAKLKAKGLRKIEISERVANGKRQRHPPRRRRVARVAIAGSTVRLRRPQYSQASETELELNVVRVWEPSPPKGQPAVEWTLFTTEPVGTREQLFTAVDHYRSRWVIEEFFKALKSGCSIEKRQLESYHALSMALSMFIPIAWRLLLARSVARASPTSPAATVASEVQLKLLRHKLKSPGPMLTAEQATNAIAKLGGHLKRNGPPGWLTLGRGLQALLLMEAGWRAAMAQPRSDQ